MFWRKKEENNVEFDGLPITLSKRSAYQQDLLYHTVYKNFLAYKQGDEWKGLVGYEEYKEKTDRLEKKLDLILKELGKEYVPESEKKEPAKLVDREMTTLADLQPWDIINVRDLSDATPTGTNKDLTNKPKKKRKTTKKKK